MYFYKYVDSKVMNFAILSRIKPEIQGVFAHIKGTSIRSRTMELN